MARQKKCRCSICESIKGLHPLGYGHICCHCIDMVKNNISE